VSFFGDVYQTYLNALNQRGIEARNQIASGNPSTWTGLGNLVGGVTGAAWSPVQAAVDTASHIAPGALANSPHDPDQLDRAYGVQ